MAEERWQRDWNRHNQADNQKAKELEESHEALQQKEADNGVERDCGLCNAAPSAEPDLSVPFRPCLGSIPMKLCPLFVIY